MGNQRMRMLLGVSLVTTLFVVCFAVSTFGQSDKSISARYGEDQFKIISEKVNFNATKLPTIEVKAVITVEANAKTDMLVVLFLESPKIKSLNMNGKEGKYSIEENLVGIKLPKLFDKGEQAVIDVNYTRKISDECQKEPYSQDMFPFYPPINPTIDCPIDVTYQVLPGCTVVTPGTLKSVNIQKEYSEYQWTGTYKKRCFDSVLAKGKLFHRKIKDVEFALSCINDNESKAHELLESISEVYFFLEDLYGPRTSRSFSIVQTPAADNMGTRYNMGGIICLQTQDLDKPRDRWLLGCLAHEIGHEWWGHVVYGSNVDTHQLKEALAELSSIYFEHKKFGLNSVADSVIVNTMAYLTESDHAAISKTKDELYSKVILIPCHLMHLIGEKAFFQTCREILKQKGAQVSFRMFFDMAEKVSGKKVQWLLDWLYYTNADTDFSLSEIKWDKKDNAYINHISLVERVGRFDYPLEVPIEITTADGITRMITSRIGKMPTELKLETASPISSVAIDPRWMLWDIDRSNNFFGCHIVLSKSSTTSGETIAEIVGGFKSKYRDEIMASLWLHQKNSAYLVPFTGQTIKKFPDIIWSPDFKEFVVLFQAEPLQAMRINIEQVVPKVIPLDSPAWLKDKIEKSKTENVQKQTKNVEEIINSLENNDEAIVLEALNQLQEYRESEWKNPRVMDYMNPLLQVLQKSKTEDIRIKSSGSLFSIYVYQGDKTKTVIKQNKQILLDALKDKVGSVRSDAAQLLYGIADKKDVEVLCDSMLMDLDNINCQAIYTLTEINDPSAVPALIKVMSVKYLWARWNVAYALKSIPDPRSIEPLINALEKEDPSTYTNDEKGGMGEDGDKDLVRTAYVEALKKITGQDFGKDVKAWKKWWQENKDKFKGK